jgi:hypothetical protein
MIDNRLLRPERRQTSAEFWTRYPELVWSNPHAEDSAYICAALLRPNFDILLDICAEFGLERVETEWRSLLQHGEVVRVNRARPIVDRMLRNIRIGFEDATRRNS